MPNLVVINSAGMMLVAQVGALCRRVWPLGPATYLPGYLGFVVTRL